MAVTGLTSQVISKGWGVPPGGLNEPLGIWVARLVLAGDASGTNIAGSVFLPSSSVYSVEGFDCVTGASTTGGFLIQWRPGYMNEGNSEYILELGVEPILVSAQRINMLARDVLAVTRMMLPTKPERNLNASHQIQVENNVLAVSYAFAWWGYYWDLLVNSHGGPRRPS